MDSSIGRSAGACLIHWKIHQSSTMNSPNSGRSAVRSNEDEEAHYHGEQLA